MTTRIKSMLMMVMLLPTPVLSVPTDVTVLASACAACHGTNGHSVEPKYVLAGQDRDYLIEQLLRFRSGERDSTVMKTYATGLTLEEIEQLADYFSQQNAH